MSASRPPFAIAPVVPVEIWSVHGAEARAVADVVAVEAPLQIRVESEGGTEPARAVSITMRTPGDSQSNNPLGSFSEEDADLAVGFLFSEGIVRGAADLAAIHSPASDAVCVTLRAGVAIDWNQLDRDPVTTSACGVCGKRSVDTLAATPSQPLADGPRLDPTLIPELTERLRKEQSRFTATGGLHAAALFSADGTLLDLREDVGRHNAVDKLLGARLRAGELPAHDQILVVSGRASFELVQKARMAAAPVFVAVGAPSSSAVELARAAGMTLCGFTRPGRCNVYSGAERLGLAEPVVCDHGERSAEWTAQPGSRRGRSLRTIPNE